MIDFISGLLAGAVIGTTFGVFVQGRLAQAEIDELKRRHYHTVFALGRSMANGDQQLRQPEDEAADWLGVGGNR